MPFCPKCRYEYEPHIAVCPDCDERLVALLPPVAEDESDIEDDRTWLNVARLTSREYAMLVQQAFQRRGIPVVVRSETGYFGEAGSLGVSSYQPVGGGYSVYVPEDFAVAADVEGTAILGDTWTKARLLDIEDAGPADDEAGEGEEDAEDR